MSLPDHSRGAENFLSSTTFTSRDHFSSSHDFWRFFDNSVHSLCAFGPFFTRLTVVFAVLVEDQVRGEDRTKDMVTASRRRTSASQLCVCLHLTSTNFSRLFYPPLLPTHFQTIFLPSCCRGNSLALR